MKCAGCGDRSPKYLGIWAPDYSESRFVYLVCEPCFDRNGAEVQRRVEAIAARVLAKGVA